MRFILGYVYWGDSLATLKFYELVDECTKKFGVPTYFHTDRGPEFVSFEMPLLQKRIGFRMSHSRSYTLTDNPKMERFYKTMKIENKYFLYQKPTDAKRNFDTWIYDYNFKRYHTSIEQTPAKGNRK